MGRPPKEKSTSRNSMALLAAVDRVCTQEGCMRNALFRPLARREKTLAPSGYRRKRGLWPASVGSNSSESAPARCRWMAWH